MGVLGLLPLLQATSRRANLSDFRGKRVGVDAYCWLYRGASSCAKQLALGEPANGHIRFCLKQLGRLVSVYGLDVVLVFDGRPLPAKEFQSLRRRLKRKECLDRAMGLQANGCNADGVFAQAVEITPEDAHALQVEVEASPLLSEHVQCLTAPYESDAQLAYLSQRRLVDLVITEDSDLLLYGARAVLFKLDNDGNGDLFEQERVQQFLSTTLGVKGQDRLFALAVFLGCDYVPAMPYFGIQRATALLNRYPKVDQVIAAIVDQVPQSYVRSACQQLDVVMLQMDSPRTKRLKQLLRKQQEEKDEVGSGERENGNDMGVENESLKGKGAKPAKYLQRTIELAKAMSQLREMARKNKKRKKSKKIAGGGEAILHQSTLMALRSVFRRISFIYKYHYVYDPSTGRVTNITPLPTDPSGQADFLLAGFFLSRTSTSAYECSSTAIDSSFSSSSSSSSISSTVTITASQRPRLSSPNQPVPMVVDLSAIIGPRLDDDVATGIAKGVLHSISLSPFEDVTKAVRGSSVSCSSTSSSSSSDSCLSSPKPQPQQVPSGTDDLSIRWFNEWEEIETVFDQKGQHHHKHGTKAKDRATHGQTKDPSHRNVQTAANLQREYIEVLRNTSPLDQDEQRGRVHGVPTTLRSRGGGDSKNIKALEEGLSMPDITSTVVAGRKRIASRLFGDTAGTVSRVGVMKDRLRPRGRPRKSGDLGDITKRMSEHEELQDGDGAQVTLQQRLKRLEKVVEGLETQELGYHSQHQDLFDHFVSTKLGKNEVVMRQQLGLPTKDAKADQEERAGKVRSYSRDEVWWDNYLLDGATEGRIDGRRWGGREDGTERKDDLEEHRESSTGLCRASPFTPLSKTRGRNGEAVIFLPETSIDTPDMSVNVQCTKGSDTMVKDPTFLFELGVSGDHDMWLDTVVDEEGQVDRNRDHSSSEFQEEAMTEVALEKDADRQDDLGSSISIKTVSCTLPSQDLDGGESITVSLVNSSSSSSSNHDNTLRADLEHIGLFMTSETCRFKERHIPLAEHPTSRTMGEGEQTKTHFHFPPPPPPPPPAPLDAPSDDLSNMPYWSCAEYDRNSSSHSSSTYLPRPPTAKVILSPKPIFCNSQRMADITPIRSPSQPIFRFPPSSSPSAKLFAHHYHQTQPFKAHDHRSSANHLNLPNRHLPSFLLSSHTTNHPVSMTGSFEPQPLSQRQELFSPKLPNNQPPTGSHLSRPHPSSHTALFSSSTVLTASPSSHQAPSFHLTTFPSNHGLEYGQAPKFRPGTTASHNLSVPDTQRFKPLPLSVPLPAPPLPGSLLTNHQVYNEPKGERTLYPSVPPSSQSVSTYKPLPKYTYTPTSHPSHFPK